MIVKQVLVLAKFSPSPVLNQKVKAAYAFKLALLKAIYRRNKYVTQ